MRTSWEKIVQCIGATHGQDISNELQNKVHVTIAKPHHSVAMLQWHAARVTVMERSQDNLQQARTMQKVMLEAAVVAGDVNAPMKLAILNNDALQA